MEEIFDIYTRAGKYLGTKPKSECHTQNPGFYHKPVWIWIKNSNNEILVQKRAACKKIILIYMICQVQDMYKQVKV